MTTTVQRLKTMVEAGAGNPVTNAELDRAAKAFRIAYAPDMPEDAPPEDKAKVMLRATQRFWRETVHAVETEALRQQVSVTPPNYGDD